MRQFKLFFLTFLSTLFLHAQSFYVLSGVDSYDPLVVNYVDEAKQYNEDIKTLMQGTAKELGIDTQGHPSRVLVFVIKKISLGDSVGIKAALELGEYVKRQGSKTEVFAVTYHDEKLFELSAEDLDDDLAERIEEMLEKFTLQYKEDNKQDSKASVIVSHGDFAKTMQYESNYKEALKKAKKLKKPLLIFMTTSYCPWCRKLEGQVLAREDIDLKIKKKYVPLMLNYDEKKFPKQFLAVKVTPTLYIVDSKSEKIVKKFVGYNNRGSFLHELKQ